MDKVKVKVKVKSYAYHQGWEAFCAGKDIAENIYSEKTCECVDWINGFYAAKFSQTNIR